MVCRITESYLCFRCYILWLLQLPGTSPEPRIKTPCMTGTYQENRLKILLLCAFQPWNPLPSSSRSAHLCHWFDPLPLPQSSGLKTLSFVFPSLRLGTFSISYPELLPPQFEFTKFLWRNEQGSFFIHQWKVNELRKSPEKARFSRPFSCNVTLDFCVPYFSLYSTYKSYLFLKQMDTSGKLKNNSEQRNMR